VFDGPYIRRITLTDFHTAAMVSIARLHGNLTAC
jgi:hypothetical protein